MEWLKAVESDNAKWLKKGGLFTTQVIAILQMATKHLSLNKHFGWTQFQIRLTQIAKTLALIVGLHK